MHIYKQLYNATLILSIFVVLSILLIHVESRAHGLEYTVSETSGKPTVYFHYSDGSPVSYTKVKVWSPDNDSIEFQNGRTDKNGRFSFVPDLDGFWRITVNDGMGHAATVEHQVTTTASGRKGFVHSPTEKKNKILYIILGCSLIMNAGFVVGGLRRTTLRGWRRTVT
jgi:nickel transport protein